MSRCCFGVVLLVFSETVFLKLGKFRDLKDIQIYLEDLFFHLYGTYLKFILTSS